MIHTFSYFPVRCGPCKLLGPRLDSVMKKHMDSVLLAKVDVDEMEELAMQLNVSLINQPLRSNVSLCNSSAPSLPVRHGRKDSLSVREGPRILSAPHKC